MRFTIKKFTLILTSICFVFFSYFLVCDFVNINSQANSDKNTTNNRLLPDILVLDDPQTANSVFAGDKGKVPFNHNQHISQRANITCITCHHTNSNNLTSKLEEPVTKCTNCHLVDDSICQIEGTNEIKNFKGKTALNAKDAYHGTWTQNSTGCLDCHKTRDIAPVGCNECHTNSTDITYIIQPLFPSIQFVINNQNTQNNQTTPNSNWHNTYSYTPNHNNYLPNHYPQNYYPQSNSNNTTPDKTSDITINNYLPNNISSVPPQEKTEIIERVIIEPIKNYNYLLEDNKPLKEPIKQVDNNNEKVITPLDSTEVTILPSISTSMNTSKPESILDQILSHINKFIIIIAIVLYLDIRRRIAF